MVRAEARAAGKASPQSFVGACALLAVILVPVALIAARVRGGEWSWLALQMAAIAFGVCWLAGCLALAAGLVAQWLGSPLHGTLGGMLFRMIPPLGVGLAIQRQAGALAAAGFVVVMLVVYLVGLVVETGLSLWLFPPAAGASSAGAAARLKQGMG